MNRTRLLSVLFLSSIGLSHAGGGSMPRFGGVAQGGSTAGLDLFDFDCVANPTLPWTSYTSIQGPGIAIGERMVGQTTQPVGNYEIVSGTPGLPLRIDESVPPGMGVSVFESGSAPGDLDMSGEGTLGAPDPSSLGEGAFTVVFERDQSVVGFSIGYATVNNSVEVLFYSRSGVLMDTLTVSFTATIDPMPVVFSATTGTLIAAITVNNSDPGGAGYDDIWYDAGAIGTSYCGPAVPNSTGAPATLVAVGSDLVADDDVTLYACGMPVQFGFFLVGRTRGMFMPPGSSGFICLSGNIGRYNATSDIFQGPGGSLSLDLGSIPVNPPIAAVPGDTWNFQAWYRDNNPALTSNFTDAVTIVFQ